MSLSGRWTWPSGTCVGSAERPGRAGGRAGAPGPRLAAAGAVERARAVLAELDEAVAVLDSSALRAYAGFARAMVETAADDLGAARRCLEDAVDGFDEHRLP